MLNLKAAAAATTKGRVKGKATLTTLGTPHTTDKEKIMWPNNMLMKAKYKARAGSQRVWDADAERWWLERAQTRHKTNWRPLPPHVNKVHVDSDDTSDEKMQSIRKKKGKVKTKGKGKIIKGKRKAAKAKKKAEIEDECDDKSRTAEQSQPATKSGACKLSPFEDDVRNDGRWLCREELEFELQFRRTNFNALATSTACSFTAPSASSLPHPWCSDKAAAAADRCALLTSAEPNTVADSPAQRSVHFTSAEEDDVSAGGNSVDGVPTAGQVFAEDAWFALEWLLGAMRVCDSAACGAIGLDGEADVAGSSACDREQYVAKARDVIRAPGFVQQCFDGLSGRGTGGAKEDEQLLELLSQLHEANAKAKEADCATHAIGADGAVTASVQGSGNGEGGTETEEGRISPSAEAEFIASLSRKDRKLLLRHLSTMPGTGTGVGDCSGEYESKRKRKRRTHEHRRKHKRKKSKSRETNLEKSSNAEADQGGSNTTCTD
eukprot:g2728.t1